MRVAYLSVFVLRTDIQCHIFPRSFIKELTKGTSQLRAADPDANGRRVILDSNTGDEVTFFIENSSYVDPGQHIKDMDDYKIDIQVLSLPPPGVDKLDDPNEAIRLSKLINNEISGVIDKYPSRFAGLATIPLNDPVLAVEEIKRSIDDLGFKGVVISSNTHGRFYDSMEYDEVFRTLERYGSPIFIHPTEPVTSRQIGQDYKMALIFGWPFDTTLLIARLALSGTLERFPGLIMIAAHGGGMVPFFGGRIDMLAKVAAGKGKKIVPQDPVKPFKTLYYDTAFFDPNSLELLVKFAGEDHVLYASDYPFGENLGRNCYEASIRMMDAAKLDPEIKAKIYSENLVKIFKM